MASSSSVSARLKQLAYTVEQSENQHRRQVLTLESTLRSERKSKSALQQRVADLEEKLELEEEKSRDNAAILKDERSKYEKEIAELTTEVVGLRFELAAALKTLRTSNRKQEIAQLVEQGSDALATSLFSIDEQDLDPDLILAEDFVSAARRNLNGVLRSVLQPETNELRKLRLKDTLGQALLEVSSHGLASFDAVKLLIKHGANVKAQREHAQGGRTALHYAAAKGSKEVVEFLVLQGAEIDALDSRGHTPLHVAARLRKPEAAKILLTKGADATIKTEQDETAEDLANGVGSSSGFSLSFSPLTIKQVFSDKSLLFWNASALALRKYKTEDWVSAMEHFSRAVETVESNPRVAKASDIARLYFNRAKVAMKLGEIVQALQDSNQALDRDAQYENALEIRAECFWSLFEFERAASDFKSLKEMTEDRSKARKWATSQSEAFRCSKASHYHILGISKYASSADIKRAFRSESIKWHPDKHARSGDDLHRARVQFQRINEAREVLSNENKRIMYDSERNRSSYFREEWMDDSDEEEDVSLSPFPWNDQNLSKPLIEKKHKYIKQKLEKERFQQMKKEEEEEEVRLAAAKNFAAPEDSVASNNQEASPKEVNTESSTNKGNNTNQAYSSTNDSVGVEEGEEEKPDSQGLPTMEKDGAQSQSTNQSEYSSEDSDDSIDEDSDHLARSESELDDSSFPDSIDEPDDHFDEDDDGEAWETESIRQYREDLMQHLSEEYGLPVDMLSGLANQINMEDDDGEEEQSDVDECIDLDQIETEEKTLFPDSNDDVGADSMSDAPAQKKEANFIFSGSATPPKTPRDESNQEGPRFSPGRLGKTTPNNRRTRPKKT